MDFRSVFAQDWGGLIGLRIIADQPDRFETVVAGNTGLPVGTSAGPGFDMWLEMSQTLDFIDCGQLVQGATTARDLTDAEVDAYRAPFPDESYMAGAREFPCLVPITPEHADVAENIAAWAVLAEWTKPFLTLWGTEDPVLGHLAGALVDNIPGAAGQPHQQYTPGGHFIQDDRGEDIAAAMIDWLAD